jgi:hypothetical protein
VNLSGVVRSVPKKWLEKIVVKNTFKNMNSFEIIVIREKSEAQLTASSSAALFGRHNLIYF